jgi:hypothetical protein
LNVDSPTANLNGKAVELREAAAVKTAQLEKEIAELEAQLG